MLYGRDPPRGLRDYEIPEVLHYTIHTVEELKLVKPELEFESETIGSLQMTQTLGSNIVPEDVTTPPFPGSTHNFTTSLTDLTSQDSIEECFNSGNSDPYDIEMRFDPKSLGATLIDLPQTQLCHVCDFSVGEERIYCHTCNSIGHKDCFKKLSPMREGSYLRYFCLNSHCQHDFLRNEHV